MSKKKVFYEIFDIVVAETEVERDLLSNSKVRTREVVDARYMIVYFLRQQAGFDIGFIAKMLSMTPQSIRGIDAGFKNRMEQSGKFFEITLQRISKKIENSSLYAI